MPYDDLTRTFTLRLVGIGPVPSFKTGKKATINSQTHQPFLYTKKEHHKWMREATASLLSQLRSTTPTSNAGIQTEEHLRSWIASLLPEDDCWTVISELHIVAGRCVPGEEGATIEVRKL